MGIGMHRHNLEPQACKQLVQINQPDLHADTHISWH